MSASAGLYFREWSIRPQHYVPSIIIRSCRWCVPADYLIQWYRSARLSALENQARRFFTCDRQQCLDRDLQVVPIPRGSFSNPDTKPTTDSSSSSSSSNDFSSSSDRGEVCSLWVVNKDSETYLAGCRVLGSLYSVNLVAHLRIRLEHRA